MVNVVNNSSWELSDVLIATPMTLAHVLKMRQAFAPFDINPALIVLDEVDLLLEQDEVDKKVIEIIRKFATKGGPFAYENSKR